MNNKMISNKIVFVLLVGVMFLAGCDTTQEPIQEDVVQAAFPTVTTGTTETGDVAIELVPKGIQNGKLIVDLSVNTHSVDLTQFDLAAITTLTYDGKTAKPISAPQLTGHHTSGTMEFPMDGKPSSFTITILGMPALAERVFSWSKK